MNLRKRLHMAAGLGALGWYVIGSVSTPHNVGAAVTLTLLGVIWPVACLLVAFTNPW